MANQGSHRFGSDSTELKLDVIGSYLHAFTTALRKKFPELIYIDVFSGSGAREVLHSAAPANLIEDARGERIEERRGSARIALDTQPPFTKVIFIEQKKAFCIALEELAGSYPGRSIEVLRGDANDLILQAISRSWAGTRAVMFIDPYGMQLRWSTLEAIRRTEAVDVWYLVTLQGLYRQATLSRGDITPRKREALNRMLGTEGWEAAWYTPTSVGTLFDPPDGPRVMGDRRVADVNEMEAFMAARLRDLFPMVSGPLRLKTKNGAPGFALFFACSNPNPAAFSVAAKIANYILKVGKLSQV